MEKLEVLYRHSKGL